MNPISIIFVHWGQNDFRSETMMKSLESLIETTKHLPCEIIVIDNGQSFSDSQYLLDLVQNKKIQHYMRNSENLYFGWGRNMGYEISSGEYLVFTDNDILYKEGWLDKCLKLLKAFPDNKFVTPLRTDRQHRTNRHWVEWLELDGERFPTNLRAGSNSWVMKREDFIKVGKFRNHYIAGSYWNDAFVNNGFTMITMEKDPMAEDIGFKKGYNIKFKASIEKVFTNGDKFSIND